MRVHTHTHTLRHTHAHTYTHTEAHTHKHSDYTKLNLHSLILAVNRDFRWMKTAAQNREYVSLQFWEKKCFQVPSECVQRGFPSERKGTIE